MRDNKIFKFGIPALIFAAVSFFLFEYREHSLWIFPLYGLIFLWLSFYQEKELNLTFIFVITVLGLMLSRITGKVSAGHSIAGIAEVAGIWILNYLLHANAEHKQKTLKKIGQKIDETSAEIKGLLSDLELYSRYHNSLLGRVTLQSKFSSTIKYLSSANNLDEIKFRMEKLLKEYFADASIEIVSGAARDIFEKWVFERKIPLLIKDSKEEKRFGAYDFNENEKSILIIPLHLFGETVGFIRLFSSMAGRFKSEDLKIVELISTVSSAAMENFYLYEKVQELAIYDGLTKLYTHRAFQSKLEEEILTSARTKMPFSVIMADIDHFKHYNDTFGHQAGDSVLKTIAAIFTQNVRDVDFVSRYGGEEFAIIVPGAGLGEARTLAENLRQIVESFPFNFNNTAAKVTASFGVAEFPSDATTQSQLIRAADERLYIAKNSGRNMVIAK